MSDEDFEKLRFRIRAERKLREWNATNRVDRVGDGGLLTDVRDDVEAARPHCPWCEEPLDDKGECARRCRASRVNRTDNR